MRFAKVDKHTFLIRLERGERVNESLKTFCQKQKVKNAVVHALGSIENPTLGHYTVDTKTYKEKKFKGIFELTNLTGTVGLFEGEPLVHTHATLVDETMRAFGGHLVEARVSATVELILINLGSSFTKSYSKEIGLRLFDL